MDILRRIVVLDAADVETESAFWAAVVGGTRRHEEGWVDVLGPDGEVQLAVQNAPDHVAPQWPDGTPQQVHMDLHVSDITSAHAEVMGLGARLLLSADTEAAEGFQVYADPAGHPFCLCWGELAE